MSGPRGMLVMASQRDLRRRLFDVLDRHVEQPIHSVRDPRHAAMLLEGSAPLELIVAVLTGSSGEAQDACRQLRAIPACAVTPIVAVLEDDEVLRSAPLPDEVRDWVAASRIEQELVPRWQRLRGAPAAPAVQPGQESAADMHLLFDADEREWLIADLRGERVREVGPALLRHSGLQADSILGRPLRDLLSFDGARLEPILAAADCRWHLCRRRAAHGFDSGEASVRLLRHRDDDALVLLFRSDRADTRPDMALALLARLFQHGEGEDDIEAACRQLVEAMRLDYLALWSSCSEDSGAPVPRFLYWRGGERQWPAVAVQVALCRVLGGGSLLHARDAAQVAIDDPLVRELELHGLGGFPLRDERGNVIGALMAGSRQGFGDAEVVGAVLACAAGRFARPFELERARERIGAERLLDVLTGLPNRLLFQDRLGTILREATRSGECFAVLFVDLDRFKSINDNLGHAVGDQVLLAVAQRLVASVRASDTVARYAGDEFVVVVRHVVRNDDVARVAEKILQAMQAPLLPDSPELHASVSIGISFCPDDAQDAETLLKHADQAMYAAKHAGRKTFQIYEVSPAQAQQQNLALKSRLRHAERNGELRVVYQPQVGTHSEDIAGMEALVRWEHPELGTIGPGFFIPLAEETGLIVPIGEWVLRTACRQAQAWEQTYGLRLRLGVNLSAVQLMQPRLLEMVGRVLQETGMDPSLLELEVTESISIKQVPNLLDNLQRLHQMGCRIAIDDFGTGAASLDYLRKLPADRIKIDQSFVRNIGLDTDDEAIVRATIDMAHRLKRGVVAEGVEIEEHFQFLRDNDCDELQGYLFSRPLTPAAFDKLLAERARLLDLPE